MGVLIFCPLTLAVKVCARVASPGARAKKKTPAEAFLQYFLAFLATQEQSFFSFFMYHDSESSSHEKSQVPHASGHASNAFSPVSLLLVLVLQYFLAFFATQPPV